MPDIRTLDTMTVTGGRSLRLVDQRVDATNREIVTRTGLPAAPDVVWARCVSPEGINYELAPWLRMTVPRHLRDVGIDAVPLGERLGRSWILALGVVPFDYDDLTLAERGPGFRFLEASRMASMRRWEHERAVRPLAEGAELVDRVAFDLRAPLAAMPASSLVAARLVGAVFRHRHRRARSYFERVR